jgi:hypothetical protein
MALQLSNRNPIPVMSFTRRGSDLMQESTELLLLRNIRRVSEQSLRSEEIASHLTLPVNRCPIRRPHQRMFRTCRTEVSCSRLNRERPQIKGDSPAGQYHFSVTPLASEIPRTTRLLSKAYARWIFLQRRFIVESAAAFVTRISSARLPLLWIDTPLHVSDRQAKMARMDCRRRQ